MNQKAIIVIQVRFNSERLPGKALLPLGGVPMIVYLIRRLKLMVGTYPIIVATTKKPEDSFIVSWVKNEGVKVVRGEENDVLARYIRCINAFSADIIVRVTADNPLTDPGLIDRSILEMKNGKYDYINSTCGYPIGAGVDVFSSVLLKHSHRKASSLYEREHINAYVLNHLREFKTNKLQAPRRLNYPYIRLTVDTSQDYKNIRKIVDSYPPGHFIEIEDAIKRANKRNI